MTMAFPGRTVLTIVLVLLAKLSDGYNVCESTVGTCIIDPSCPAGSTCNKTGITHTGSCICNVGSCAVNHKCVPASSVTPQPSQPTLEFSDWFLNASQIAQASGGHPRIGLQDWSTGNHIQSYAEAIDLWAGMWDEISALGPGGRFWDTSWLIGSFYQLVPSLDAAGTANTSIGEAMSAAGLRGAQVLALSWRNIASTGRFSEVNEFVDQMQAAAAKATKAGLTNRIEAHSDGRINPTGSLHQKTVIVDVGNKTVSYVGGVDFCESRWDVFGGNSSYPPATSEEGKAWQKKMWALRAADGAGGEGTDVDAGFHDTEFRLDGPAAFDVALNFAQRWNEQACYLTDGVPVIQPPLKPIAVPTIDQFSKDVGSHAVQVLRTFGCKYAQSSGCYKSFAPQGEYTVHTGLIKAVQTARSFIYIEDQYFFFVQELYDALREALRTRIQHVILLIQYPQEAPGFSTMLWRFWMPLFQEFPHRVHAFYRKGGVYIHSKTKVFDDVWSLVGSPNIGRRSHTFDAEIGAAVVDSDTLVSADGFNVSKFAHSFRVHLWEDATGIPASVWETTTIADSISMWNAEAAKDNGKIGAFTWKWTDPSGSIPKYEEWADNSLFRDTADPEGRCNSGSSDFLMTQFLAEDQGVNHCPEGTPECQAAQAKH